LEMNHHLRCPPRVIRFLLRAQSRIAPAAYVSSLGGVGGEKVKRKGKKKKERKDEG